MTPGAARWRTEDGDRITGFANVGSLGAKSFLKDVRCFVLAVRDIKAKVAY